MRPAAVQWMHCMVCMSYQINYGIDIEMRKMTLLMLCWILVDLCPEFWQKNIKCRMIFIEVPSKNMRRSRYFNTDGPSDHLQHCLQCIVICKSSQNTQKCKQHILQLEIYVIALRIRRAVAKICNELLSYVVHAGRDKNCFRKHWTEGIALSLSFQGNLQDVLSFTKKNPMINSRHVLYVHMSTKKARDKNSDQFA